MKLGTQFTSSSWSSTTSKFPTAAWNWLMSWIDFSSAGWLRSIVVD